jgi:hypothetical protein
MVASVQRVLRHHGLGEDDEVLEDDEGYAQLQLSSAVGRQSLGGQPGQRTERRTVTRPFERRPKPYEAHVGWTSLHAGTRVRADDRKGLERLCRYLLRPAVALSRLAIDGDDRVTVSLRSPWQDGTGALRFDPVDFIGRLASLVPPRRQPMIRYHGVLAPASPWRSRVVPRPTASMTGPRRSRWHRWASLIERTFGHDPQRCPHCGETMRQVALLRAGSRAALVWLQVQGDLLLTGPPARGDPSTSRLSSSC